MLIPFVCYIFSSKKSFKSTCFLIQCSSATSLCLQLVYFMHTASCLVDLLKEKYFTLTLPFLKSRAQSCSPFTVTVLSHQGSFTFSWDSLCIFVFISAKNLCLNLILFEMIVVSNINWSLALYFMELDGVWEDWELHLCWFFCLWSQLRLCFTGDLRAWLAWSSPIKFSNKLCRNKWLRNKKKLSEVWISIKEHVWCMFFIDFDVLKGF